MLRRRWAVVAAVMVLVAVAAAVWAVAGAAPGASAEGQAELKLTGPSDAQSTSAPFDVTLSITRAATTWAGYNAQILYDTSVLEVKDVVMVKIANCDDNSWAVTQKKPTIIALCVFQESTETGPVDTITFQCLRDGASVLHLVTTAEDTIQGSTLFDENAVNIPTDLVDGPTITCGAGGPVATVPVPTNPPQSEVQTAVAGARTPHPPASPAEGTPGAAATDTQAAEGTPGAAATGTRPGTPGARGTGTPAASGTSGSSVLSAPARTSTAAARALAGGSSSGGGSSNTGLIVGIVVAAAVVAAAGAGGYLLWRRRMAAR